MVAVDGELAVGALHGGGEHMCWQEQQQQRQQRDEIERVWLLMYHQLLS